MILGLYWLHHIATLVTYIFENFEHEASSFHLEFYRKVSKIKPFLHVCQCFPVFCVWAPELSTSCLGTCILLSLCDPVFSPPWVGCDPASLQLPQVTNSHPGAHVIQGMYFSTLYALCHFLKFSKNLTGHRSSYQTEAVDKNSN